MSTYNLVDESWIPVVDHAGTMRRVGIRTALVEAHTFARIAADPPVEAALLRFLLAVLHRCTKGPASARDWGDLWAAETIPAASVDRYLSHWHERFDLFDPVHPFMQNPTAAPVKSPALLFPAMASGNNPTLFDHTLDDRPASLDPGVAACGLLAFLAFASGGLLSGDGTVARASAKAGPLSGQLVFFVIGSHLGQTLLLNLPVYNPSNDLPFPVEGSDLPAWERDLAATAQERDPAGWLDWLTYPSRRIQLHGNPDEVTGVRITDGDRPTAGWSPHTREIAVAYRTSKQGPVALRPRSGRSVWRDIDSILVAHSEAQRPRLIDMTAERLLDGQLDSGTRLGLNAYALATDQAKYESWTLQQLPLPLGLLNSDESTALLTSGVNAAEQAERHVRAALDEIGFSNVASRCASYWGSLSISFAPFVLSAATDQTAARTNWADAIRRAATTCVDESSNTCAPNARSFKRWADARAHLARAVRVARTFEEST